MPVEKTLAPDTLNCRYKNITLVGDIYGIKRMLKFVPREKINCFIAASIRPQYLRDIKQLANELNIDLLVQPKFNSPEYKSFLSSFKSKNTELLICDSYSMILREDLLEHINYNAINLHFSLLPKNRGCNPVQWSIIKGESETGATLHYIDKGMDTGDIVAQSKTAVESNDTWLTLTSKILLAAEKLLEQQIKLILEGKNSRVQQNEELASVNPRLTPESPQILFDSMSDLDVYNLIRAQVEPLKGAYIINQGEKVFFNKLIPLQEIKALRTKYAEKNSDTSA